MEESDVNMEDGALKWKMVEGDGRSSSTTSVAQPSREVEKVLENGSKEAYYEDARQKDESLSIEHSERRPPLLPSSEGFSGRRSLCTNRDLMELAGVLRGIHSRVIREGYRFENGEYIKP